MFFISVLINVLSTAVTTFHSISQGALGVLTAYPQQLFKDMEAMVKLLALKQMYCQKIAFVCIYVPWHNDFI